MNICCTTCYWKNRKHECMVEPPKVIKKNSEMIVNKDLTKKEINHTFKTVYPRISNPDEYRCKQYAHKGTKAKLVLEPPPIADTSEVQC